jgi:integrase
LNVGAGKSFGFASKPETFRLMCDVQLDIGLRISDTILFDPSTMEPGLSLNVYSFVQQKSRRNGKAPRTIEAFLDDKLKKAIQDCEWLSPELPFRYGTSSLKDLGNNFYLLMQSVGERCGVEDCRPHRLRDTFAVRMLADGMLIDDLSQLLGHKSVGVTRKHYGKWIPKRSQRLERLVLAVRESRV